MPLEKRSLYDAVFMVPNTTEYLFCKSCHEYFTDLPTFPSIDNSNKTMREKIVDILHQEKAGKSKTDRILPASDEVLELIDENSDGAVVGMVAVPIAELLKKYLHFDLDGTACYLCVISFVLLRSVWLNRPVGHILPFINEARIANYQRQAVTINEILEEVQIVADTAKEECSFYQILFNVALKRK